MNHKHLHLVHPKYRPDIDGLRSIAILAVVFFHSFPRLMPSGFIGVDIFFVISGYLISTIIFSSLERDRFSLIEFYVRRINRIFPALILVLLSCLATGWFVLLNDEYRQLGKHAAAGAGFLQNFILFREGGYFDNAAETKPLLHLWTLAIEEQFYIFWPLLLAFVWKRHWSFLKITSVIAVISFTANIHLIQTNPIADFYLPTSRFWELMIGGMLAYTVLHRQSLISRYQNTQSALGFSLLLIGFFSLNKGSDFPGWGALLPTLGTFFIISAGPNALLNKKVLSSNLMLWIGLISYPLYLWHWPLLSFFRIVEGEASQLQTAFIVLIAVLLAWLTYMYVEKPFRRGGNPRIKSIYLLITMLLTLVVGISIFQNNGFNNVNRISGDRGEYLSYFDNSIPEWNYFANTDTLHKYRSDCDFYDLDKYRINQATLVPRSSVNESCFTRDFKRNKSVFIWGDSHAQMLYFGLQNNLPKNWQILMGVSSGCAANPNIIKSSSTNYCEHSNWFALQTIAKEKPDVVIVAQDSKHSLDKMSEIITKLKQLGVMKIIFTGPSPHWKPDLPKLVVRNFWKNTPQRTWAGVDNDVIKLNHQISVEFKRQPNLSYINLIDYLCNDEGCLIYIGADRKLGITTWDYGHLTPVASDLVAKAILVKEIVAPIE